MNKKDYQRPATRVVELQQQCHIMAMSDEQQGSAERADYESTEW